MTTEIEPATVDDIRGFLATMARATASIFRSATQEPWTRRSLEQLVLDLGQPWQPQPLPEVFEQLIPKQCFLNTWELVRGERSLRYVEGYALSAGGVLPVQHAWAVGRDDRVIDPTWNDPEHAAYYGVVIPKRSVQAMMTATGYVGFFGNDYLTGNVIQRLGRIPTPDEIREGARDRRLAIRSRQKRDARRT